MKAKKTNLAVVEEAEKALIPTAITPSQQIFIEQLLQGRGVGEAALIAGVSRRTGTRWLDEASAVAIEYEKQRIRALQAFHDRVGSIMGKALATMEDCLDEQTPLALRYNAARLLLMANPRYLAYNVWLEDASGLLQSEKEQDISKARKKQSEELDEMLLNMGGNLSKRLS